MNERESGAVGVADNHPKADQLADQLAWLSRVRIVLVGTTHPGNIGGAARAMKTMGLSDLALVAPRLYPHADATAMASGADDLLARTSVFDSLEAAVADCHAVFGASARLRRIEVPFASARQLAEIACQRLSGPDAPENGQGERIAFVFGRERTGLTNEELDLCQRLLHIDANPDYSSLNLAQAVQVVSYELRCAGAAGAGQAPKPATSDAPRQLAEQVDVERLTEHLERTLVELAFLKPSNPRKLMRKLRRLIHRAELDAEEINILRGILTAVNKRC